MPPRSASTKTVASGSSTNTLRKMTVMAIMTTRTQGASLVTRGGRAGTKSAVARVASDIAEPLAAPGLEEIDREEQDEGDDQHDRRDDGRGGVVVLLQLHHDQERRNFGNVGHVA